MNAVGQLRSAGGTNGVGHMTLQGPNRGKTTALTLIRQAIQQICTQRGRLSIRRTVEEEKAGRHTQCSLFPCMNVSRVNASPAILACTLGADGGAPSPHIVIAGVDVVGLVVVIVVAESVLVPLLPLLTTAPTWTSSCSSIPPTHVPSIGRDGLQQEGAEGLTQHQRNHQQAGYSPAHT